MLAGQAFKPFVIRKIAKSFHKLPGALFNILDDVGVLEETGCLHSLGVLNMWSDKRSV